jgi:2,4-didehydro-3-deoxy-L-rhamnonate hydrolase
MIGRAQSIQMGSYPGFGSSCHGISAVKLLRYGPPGREKPGLLDGKGHIRDLSRHIVDLTPDSLDQACWMGLAAINPGTLPKVIDFPRLGAPVSGTARFIAVGRNYRDHATGSDLPVSDRPVIFMTDISRPHGPNDDVCTSPGAAKLDWGVGLGAVIGRRAAYVDRARSLDYICGYMVVHDLSDRWFQNERHGTGDTGTAAATFGPVGPW